MDLLFIVHYKAQGLPKMCAAVGKKLGTFQLLASILTQQLSYINIKKPAIIAALEKWCLLSLCDVLHQTNHLYPNESIDFTLSYNRVDQDQYPLSIFGHAEILQVAKSRK